MAQLWDFAQTALHATGESMLTALKGVALCACEDSVKEILDRSDGGSANVVGRDAMNGNRHAVGFGSAGDVP